MTVAARKKGNVVKGTVPRAEGEKTAKPKDPKSTAVHAQSSLLEKGEGFSIGSAGIISVFTIPLTIRAVYPATAREATHPPTGQSINANYQEVDPIILME